MAKLPIIHQTEATECGLACLAMLGNYHGHNLDLGWLRARFPISLKGVDLSALMSIAGTLGLAPRALTLDMVDLPKLALPCIIHWDMNHFVVLKSVNRSQAIIHDPARGRRALSLSEFGNHFTGVALELTPRADFVPLDEAQKPRLSMLWSNITGLKTAISQTLILSIILQALVLTAPLYLQISVDAALPRGDHGLLLALALGFGGLALLRVISEALRSWAILIYGQQLSLQMAGNVFAHLIRLPMNYFEKRHIGDIISRINSTQPIQLALTRDVATLFIDALMALITLAVMFIFSPELTLIVMVTAMASLGLTLWLYPKIRAAQEEVINRSASENSYVIESLRASISVKLFGREAQRESSWRNLFTRYINSSTDYGKLTIIQRLMDEALSAIQLILIIYLGITMIMASPDNIGFTLGMLFAFLMYRQFFSTSLASLLEKFIEFRLLGLHLERLSDIVTAAPETGLQGQFLEATLAMPIKGDIVLDNISFRYSPLEPWILKDFSAHFKAGEMSVLTGASGHGKTTLLKLILGLYEPEKGQILIDGHPLNTLDKVNYRRQIGTVMQDDTLLSASLAENISFFDPELDMDRVRISAQMACIDDDIMAMPMGYQSLIGDMGSSLSGGQRQRILIARALYKNPKILCMDEGTANLDMQTEAEIAQIIDDLPITRLIIAHRPEFIQKADLKLQM